MRSVVHALSVVLISVLLVGCLGAESPSKKGLRSDLDVAALKVRLEEGALVLIDVRTESEYQSGHVPSARHLPLDRLEASAFQKGPVYVICASGGRSSRAADTLANAGVEAVNITGGTRAWQAAGFPVESP
jgi:thioredoxin 1